MPANRRESAQSLPPLSLGNKIASLVMKNMENKASSNTSLLTKNWWEDKWQNSRLTKKRKSFCLSSRGKSWRRLSLRQRGNRIAILEDRETLSTSFRNNRRNKSKNTKKLHRDTLIQGGRSRRSMMPRSRKTNSLKRHLSNLRQELRRKWESMKRRTRQNRHLSSVKAKISKRIVTIP